MQTPLKRKENYYEDNSKLKKNRIEIYKNVQQIRHVNTIMLHNNQVRRTLDFNQFHDIVHNEKSVITDNNSDCVICAISKHKKY